MHEYIFGNIYVSINNGQSRLRKMLFVEIRFLLERRIKDEKRCSMQSFGGRN